MTERPGYNGYSARERDKNFEELKRQIAAGTVPLASAPCGLCGDTGEMGGGHVDAVVEFEYHNEDYSLPLCTTAPGLISLCRHCHRDKLHKRFSDPIGWNVFLAHVRRGGYARDLKDRQVALELKVYREALERGETGHLCIIGPYAGTVGHEWFAALRMDSESMKDPKACVRP